jgi:hypothetical protein
LNFAFVLFSFPTQLITVNITKEAAAHALDYHTSEAGRFYRQGAAFSPMERLEIVELFYEYPAGLYKFH